ncbi:MAG: hypothetical protein EYC70_12580 [Planctomycetota bacterium]|nr:MAG: hypothetical protein EYC70_12580 [Planctomycetota bacterium]
MKDAAGRLVLVVTASHKGAVGFADVFDCHVQRVREGSMPESRIRLTVLPSDKEHLRFLATHLHPAAIELGFTRAREGEPYDLAPISGFVDQNRTAWGIEFIREAQD